MKVLQQLTMEETSANLEKLRQELAQGVRGWMPFEDEPKTWQGINRAREVQPFLALNTPRDSDLTPATLFLHTKNAGTTCFLGNLIPDNQTIHAEEYNRILQAFYRDCLQEYEHSLELQITFSPDEVFLEDTLSPHNMYLLKYFSRHANRSTGSRNPSSYKDWMEFLSSSLSAGEILPSGLLERWLTEEEGWPRDIAMDLEQEYRFSKDLFQHLNSLEQDKERVYASA